MSRQPPANSQGGAAAPQTAADESNSLSDEGVIVMEGHMEDLAGGMRGEYDKLQALWEAFANEKGRLDRLRARILSVSVQPMERLKLNIGGTKFEIRQSSTKNNTYFRSLVAETYSEADKDDEGFYYIDRSPQYVGAIMSFLRNGKLQCSLYDDAALESIREEAEFYMVTELLTLIDTYRKRSAKSGAASCPVNLHSVSTGVNGIFFEVEVSKPFKLQTVSFVAGESRKIVGEVYYREGSLDVTSANFRKLGSTEQMVTKGGLVVVQFQPILLSEGTHTLGVYSVSAATAVAVCAKRDGQKDFAVGGPLVFTMARSYHTTNQRGLFNQRAGENEYDFCGELGISVL